MTEEQLSLWKQKKNKCEACGNIMETGYKFCDKCGAVMPEVSIPITDEDFRKIKLFEIILFISFALLMCVIVIFPVSIYSVHENLTFYHSEDFTSEQALTTATIVLTVILTIVNIALVSVIKYLSKHYWKTICNNPRCIIEQRDFAISLNDRMMNSKISTKEFEKQRKALSQIIFNTLLKFYL